LQNKSKQNKFLGLIKDNILFFYTTELEWIKKLKSVSKSMAAIVINEDQEFPKCFQEMHADYGTRKTFRVFINTDDAVSWLLG